MAFSHLMWDVSELGDLSGALPKNTDNSLGNWSMEISNSNPPGLGTPPRPTTTRDLDSQRKRRRSSSNEEQSVHIESEWSSISEDPKPKTKKQQKKRNKTLHKKGKKMQQHDVEVPGASTKVNAENESRPTSGHSHSKPNQKRPFDRFHQRNQNQPPPTFLQHPVILEDLKTGSSTFLESGPFTTKLFQTTVGPILSQRPLPSGKFLIGCRSREQQEALLKTKNLAGVHIKCTKPQATTEGVIKPIPTAVDVESLASEPNIREVRRLTHRDGTKSQAVRLTFCLAKLPAIFKVDCQEFVVHPYVPPVRRCTKCNRLGHLKAQCRSRVQVCPRCGGQDHCSNSCPNQPKCINCRGPHSAAFQGCPEQKLRLVANRIRSGTFIPYSEALKRARVELESKKTEQIAKVTVQPHDDFWREEPGLPKTSTPVFSYADAVRGSPKAKKKLEMDRAPDRAPARPQETLRPRRPSSSCVTAQNIRAKAQRVAIQKQREDKKMDQLVETITTKVLQNVLKKITFSVGTQTEVAVRPEQAKTKTVQTQTEDTEMEQEPVFNAEESIRAVLLTDTESLCMYPGGPPLVLEPTVPKKKKNRKKSQKS